MLYLLLAIASSATIAVVMRLSSRVVRGNISMLAVNYLTCLSLAALYARAQLFSTPLPDLGLTVGLGAVNGVLYLAGFVLLQYNTRKSGVVLSSVFMKLGLLVPMTLSVLAFAETPTLVQGIGFLLAVVAIVLINYEKKAVRSGAPLPLVLMLLAGGGGDAMSKVFEVYGDADKGDLFLFYTFVSALLLCLAMVVWKKERPDRYALLFGALIGIPNFFSAKFLLLSLGSLPAVIVYPTFSVATILAVTLVGVLFFKEKLRKLQWTALTVILAALVMLNV